MTGIAYWCRACDVYGVGRTCWSCHTWETAILGVHPFADGSPQVHVDAKVFSTIAGRIVQLDPIETWSEVIGCG